MKKIEAEGKFFNIYWTTGTVKSEKKYSTTNVSGGGSTINGQGSVSISSTTTIHDDIFIIDESGKEHSFQLSNFDVACREGNKVSVVWAILEGKERGPYVLVINHDTLNNYFVSDMALGELYDHSLNKFMKSAASGVTGCLLPLILLVGIVVFSIILVIVFHFFGGFIKLLTVLVIVGSVVWAYKKFKSLKEMSANYIRKFKSELLALNIK